MDKEIIKTEVLIYEYPVNNDSENNTGTKTNEIETKPAAVNGVDITIGQGEFVAVLGHNGSGKSTLAKLINALIKPTGGTIFTAGMDTKDDSNLWKIRSTAGMVFQNPDNQIVATIVGEDVAFGPENLGVKQKEIVERVKQSLEAVGMLEYIDAQPHRLSGGQKQRVAIAGVLAMHPKILILDEPTSMLDPNGRKEVMETIARLNKQDGITVILITHYMDEAARANRVIVMEEGKVVMDGTPKQVFCRVEQLKAIGLDVPQVTEIAFKLREKGIELGDGILTIDEMVDALCQYR